ncbi:MAG: phosphatidylserine decarboxylase family protein [Phycisphaerales bacterium]|nr:phosphatidylserine decarboxylase family protein [Phycisphaerales bacterium]
MPLTRYGLREWLVITVVCVAVAAVAAWLSWWWWIVGVALVWLALVAFFRDPIRRVPTDLAPGAMLSPADGVVSKVFSVDAHEAVGGGPATVVRIFLSVLDVHVNRSPCDGEVTSLVHRPGRYLDARREESAKVNESNLVTLLAPWGDPVGVRQVSGAIARRIVCPLQIGDRVRRGQRFGMIKFGSTTELILPHPERVTVLVREGQRVKGGLTLLAELALGPAAAT